MKPASTWSVKGIDSITRELAKKAAHERGMTLGQWLNDVIRRQAEETGEEAAPDKERAGTDPDIAHKLDELAEQLRALVHKEQSTAVSRFTPPGEDEAAGLAEVIERIERNEAATAKTLDVINARLDELAAQMRDVAARVAEHGEPATARDGELETALRNVVEHLEQSETRTSETLEHIQRRLNDVAAQAAEAAELAAAGGGGKTLEDIERRLEILNGHLAEIRERTPEDGRADVDAHLEKLAERVDAVYRTSQGLPGKVEGLVSEIAEARFGEIESRIDTMVSRLRSQLEQMAAGALEFDKVSARVDELDRKLDQVASQAASAQELEGMRAAIEQLSMQVEAKADKKDFDAITRRLETFITSLKEDRAGRESASGLEKRVLELEETLRKISESGDGPAAAVADETAERLEESIRLIERRLEKAEDKLNHLPVLENSIAALNRALEDMQLSGDASGEDPADEIRALQEGLQAVKDAAASSDARTRETLTAVHETLAHIIDKLDTFEREAAGTGSGNNATDGGSGEPKPAAEKASAAVATGKAAPSGASPAAQDMVSRLASEAARAAQAADSQAVDATPRPTTATPGRKPASPAERNKARQNAGDDDAPLKEDFIAAARRAAMAASGTGPDSGAASGQGLIGRLVTRKGQRPEDDAPSGRERTEPRPGRDKAETDEAERKSFSLSFFGRNRKDAEAEAKTGREQRADGDKASAPAVEEAAEAGGGRRRRLLLMGVVLLAAVSALVMRQQQNAESPASETVAPAVSTPTEGKATDAAPATPKATEDDASGQPGNAKGAGRSTYLFEKLNARIAALSDTSEATENAESGNGADGIVTASLGDTGDKTTDASHGTGDGAKTQTGSADGIGTPALRAAAEKGDPRAQFIMGSHHLERRDFSKAAEWFGKAARRGLAVAQYRLGTLYERGRGVKRDAKEALKWYEKAAKAGNVKAMHNLAVMLTNGQGGRTSYAEAARWFLAAARHGLRDSQYNLAVLYQRGLGVLKDEEEAYKWFGIAARIGDADAARLKDKLKAGLDKATVARLDKEISSWKPARAVKEANFIVVDRPEWRSRKSAGTTAAATTGPGRILKGAERIRRIQELLNRLGYDVGPADGKMGNRTANAIRLFQLQAGLPVNGQPSDTVLRLLERRISGNAPRKDRPSA